MNILNSHQCHYWVGFMASEMDHPFLPLPLILVVINELHGSLCFVIRNLCAMSSDLHRCSCEVRQGEARAPYERTKRHASMRCHLGAHLNPGAEHLGRVPDSNEATELDF